MRTNIVIPVKDFASAKQRLSAVLGDPDRIRLARCLYERTLAFFARHFASYPVLVVTDSRSAAAIARRCGATALFEPAQAGLSAAAQWAADWSARHGFDRQLLVPTDIAELDDNEIRGLLEYAHPGPSVVICPARDAGTNALLTTPPGVIPFRFGARSSELHRDSARRQGIECTILDLPHLRFDVDSADDLQAWRRNNRDAWSKGSGESSESGEPCKTP